MKGLSIFIAIIIIVICSITFSTNPQRPIVKIASFNILRLGQAGYDIRKDWDKTVTVLSKFDVIVLIEVISDDTLDMVIEMLEEKEGKNWVYSCSAPLGRTGYKERYAIIWRDEDANKISAGPEGLYPDVGDSLEREPYYATFRSGKFDYTLVCMHSYWGDGNNDPKDEAKLMDDVFNYIQDLSSEDDVILVGDLYPSCEVHLFGMKSFC